MILFIIGLIAVSVILFFVLRRKKESGDLIEYSSEPQHEQFNGGGRGRGGGGRGGGGGGRHRWRGLSWPWTTWPLQLYSRPYYYYVNYPYTSIWNYPSVKYSIRLGLKADNHPFAGQGSNLGFTITRGISNECSTSSGGEFVLQRGITYEFDIYTRRNCITGEDTDEPFFFTMDSRGGSRTGYIFNVLPTSNGTMRITITSTTPSQFFYQSTNSAFVGGKVFVQ